MLALVIAAGSLFVACNKDDNPTPVPDKVKKLMVDWKIDNIVTPKKNQPEVDSVILKACMTDDIIRFNNSGFDFQDGTAKCDSTVFNYAKWIWAYKIVEDSIQLGATVPAKYWSWKVITLNDSVLKVKYIDSANPANKMLKTISFKR